MPEIEVFCRVYNESGEYLTVRPSADFPEDSILLVADGKENQEHFGAVRLELDNDMWGAICSAISKVAENSCRKPEG